MLDGLLKSKFYCKCKSDIKMARKRIEIVMKKRVAMQKYLRNDVADLLRNGLDANAYGRADGLLVEMIRTSCYEFVDQCCERILKNVSAMDKQRECPEECREAVSTLMFAAARFADLPELRELRTLFSERYVNLLDCFINKEFAGKMKSGPASKDSKLQLLQEIAAESGLDWDSKALENKLFNESAYNDKNIGKEIDNINGSDQKKDHQRSAAHELMQYAQEFKPETKNGLTSHEQKEASRNEDLLQSKKEEIVVHPVKDIQVDTIRKTEGKEDNNLLKYKSVAPPYTKPEVEKPKSVRRRNQKPEIDNGEPEKKMERTNKEKVAQGQRILRFFDNDVEPEKQDEDEIDRLLQHYSKKNGPSSTDEKGKVMKPRTNRLSSLPVGLAEFPEGSKKQHTRSSSLQLHGNNNGHVHPKLPDYDDFVARLAAFRGSKD